MTELNFDTIASIAGFRLQYLEVLNWGTFNQNMWKIEPKGFNSLLTGDIGSGKSTLVDALTTLLVPSNKITFNKAAGAESKERNLLTYVRGEYKKEKEEITKTAKKIYLRPDDNTHTVIVANFFNEGYQENVCLAQVFWVKDGKVEKLLIGSGIPLSIKTHLSNFSEIAELKKRLRSLSGVSLFDDNFSKYSEHFRHRFGMTSDKAIDLFYQTVSMKSVSSLTDFVREQMLEKTDVKEQIGVLLKRFDELNKAHAAVVHAREQYNHLKPLVEFAVQYGEVSAEIDKIEEMLTVIPAWFAEKKIGLIQTAIAQANSDLELASLTLEGIQEETTLLDNKRFGLKQDIDNNGGKRLEQISEEIKKRSTAKDSKKREWDNYDLLAKRSGLSSAENESDFIKNLQNAQVVYTNCEKKENDLRDDRDKTVIKLREKENELLEEQTELNSLQARKSQIPAWLIEIRNQICIDLRIEEDELPFAGELLKVHEEETDWEGAVEKLLHDFGISLLVPSIHYRSVSRYVNGKTLRSIDGRGRKLTYLEADINKKDSYTKQLSEDSVVNKIETKPDTVFDIWLENYLHRNFGDFACVEVEELQQIPYAITKQGLIKSGRIRHTKDDRWNINDKRNFVLGWTNVEKIKALQENVIEIEATIKIIKGEKTNIEKEEVANNTIKIAVSKILELKDYNIINWQLEVIKIFDLEKEQNELLDKNDLLNTLKKSLEEVENNLKDLKERGTQKDREIGGLQTTIKSLNSQLDSSRSLFTLMNEKMKERYYSFIEEKIGDKTFKLTNADSFQEQFKKQFEGENGELKKLRSNLTRLATSITRKMRDIKDHSKAEYSEFSEDVEARAEYIKKFEQLANEDLKKHEERFKEELNRNVINGRGSDESTRYGLELFRKLNLQLLIVTPLQKIHIIENHVNAFHFISNRDGNNSQISNLTVQQYKEEKAKRNLMLQSAEKIETDSND